jgi:hypothetical protein
VLPCFLSFVATAATLPCSAQTLAWSAAFDGADGLLFSEPAGPSSLAVDGDGNTYALSHANNGTEVGLLVKYSALGYQIWNRIERDGWPLAVTVDDLGRPSVLTQERTLAYDANGGIRWGTDHVVDGRFLRAYEMAAAPRGHVFVAGITGSALGLMRLDEAGRALWLRALDTPDGQVTAVDGLGVDRSGRVYVAGRGPDTAGPDTTWYFVAAFAGDGSPLWQRSFSGTSKYVVYRQELKAVMGVDPNGGASLSLPRWPFVAFQTVKLDVSGITLWSSDEASLPDNGDGPVSAAVAEDGSVFVQGWAWSQAVVVGHNAAGTRMWRDFAWAAPGALVVGATGRVIATWTEAGALRVVAYEASGAVAGSFRAAGGRLPATLQAAGLVASPSGGARVQALGQDLGGPRTHLVLAFGPTAQPEWAEVGWPYGVPSAEWALSARFDAGGNALVLVSGARDRVLKHDPSGGLLWSQEPLGGTTSHARVLGFAASPSGDSVAAGADYSSVDAQPRVVKLDASGAIAWLRADLLTPPYRIGEAKAAVVDPQGAVYVAGWGWDPDSLVQATRLFLCKYSADGQLLWRRFDSSPEAYGYWPVLVTMAPGGRIVVGGTVWQLPDRNLPSPRVWVVDESGNDVWAASPGTDGDILTALVADSGGAVVAGSAAWSWGLPVSLRGRVYRLGVSGALEWSRSAPSRRPQSVNALSLEASGEITVAYSEPCLLERLSPSGHQLWIEGPEAPGGPASCDTLAPRPAGGFFVAGSYQDPLDSVPHGYVAAYDALGRAAWARDAGAPRSGSSGLSVLDSDSSGRVLTAGYAYRGATDYDAVAQVITDDPQRPLSFYTVTPCRAFDTRDPALGGPLALAANIHTEVSLAGRCGVPASARAVAVNLTAVTASSAGHLSAFPAGRIAPVASALNFGRGSTRASQATLGLGDGGRLALRPIQPSGLVHLVIDVSGYFE